MRELMALTSPCARRPHVERMLLALPNVTGVGFGWKETCGLVTGRLAWRVYVRPKVPLQMLRREDVVPPEIDGFATDVVAAARALPAALEDALPETLTPGRIVSNLRGLRPGQPVDRNESGLGTLGCFALVNGSRQREVVLVSNRHVLLAHGASRGEPIYCPVLMQRGDTYVLRADTLEPVADILHEGAEGNHTFAYAGEDPQDYFVDCASGRMRSDRVGPAGARGVARMHPLDAVGGRAPRVRKIGGATGITFGQVLDVVAPVENAAGERRLGNLMIRGADGAFVEPGDSGALVLDSRDRAVGLVWGRSDRDRRVGYACHIHPVLDTLAVTMLAGDL